MSKDSKLLKAFRLIDMRFGFLEARTSEAFVMIIPARFIQATLSPYLIALSTERTHYTTELVKNQDYFKAVFIAEKPRNFSHKYHFLLNKKIHRLKKMNFKLIKYALLMMSNSSAQMDS